MIEDFEADEFEEYVFINPKNFLRKLRKWDFLETSSWYWDFYWVSKYLPEWDICVILDPIWRDQVLAKYARWELNWYEIRTIFININKITQKNRLKSRWDGKDQVRKRWKDFDWVFPTPECKVIDWTANIEELIKIIEDEF